MVTTAAEPAPTGLDLKVERVRAGVTLVSLAGRMGVSRQHIGAIEKALRPTPATVDQYRAALQEAVASGELGRRGAAL